jgi:ferredoxin
MSAQTFANRSPENVVGRFYVTAQCLDCAACVDIAPHIFASAETRHAYVAKQPDNEADVTLALKAVATCPVRAIMSDGLGFDAVAAPA